MSSNTIACRVCHQPSDYLWSGELLSRSVAYYECSHCDFVQTEMPDWLDEAYEQTINVSDTGILERNLANAKLVVSTLFVLKGLDKKVVDCAGGYGTLVRLLRDKGVEASHSDPYCENLFAQGFEHDGSQAFLATAFEAFEHFVDPVTELEKLFSFAPNILISTTLIPKPTPQLGDWWYYGLEHGQHVSFYRQKSMEVLAKKFGKYFASNGKNYHLFSDKPINKFQMKMIKDKRGIINRFAERSLTSKTWSDHQKML